MKNTEKVMDKIVALCKGRGFVYPGSEIYGGLSNTWDYGPLGMPSFTASFDRTRMFPYMPSLTNIVISLA